MATKTFKSVFDEQNKLQKRALVTRIAKVTQKSEFTVKMWLTGRQKPDTLTRQAIAKELGISADELFND